MDEQSTPLTPVPAPPEKTEIQAGMSFSEAMNEIKNGKLVARLSWKPAADYCFMKDEWLSVYRQKDNQVYVWKVHKSDIEGDDWVVLAAAN